MPYIPANDRDFLNHRYGLEDKAPIMTVGELTYVLTKVVEGHRKRQGTNFETLADIVVALEQAKDEFQRRVVHPYEDTKKNDNGDVYEWTVT